jgi:hypothetical protein
MPPACESAPGDISPFTRGSRRKTFTLMWKKLNLSEFPIGRYVLRQATGLRIMRNISLARQRTGIEYIPLQSLVLPSLPANLRFVAKFPDGATHMIHLTEERGYEDIDGMAHLEIYDAFIKNIMPNIVRKAMSDPVTVLDCACGSGYGSNRIAEYTTAKVVGVDVNRQVIAYAQRRYSSKRKGIEFFAKSAEQLSDFPDESFEGVISVETIEHISNPQVALAEFARVLKKGGYS